MATRTNGAGYISVPTGGLPSSADNWSWCGWFERVGDQNAESIIMNFAGSAGTIGQLRINSDGDSIFLGNQAGLSGSLWTLSNNTPVFLAISCSAGTMTGYARGIGDGSFSTVTLARSSYTPSTSTLQGMTWGWQPNGRLSHSKFFSRAVTAAEWGDQWTSKNVTAALSGVCVGDVRLEGANLTAALTATVGSDLTSSGTVTVENFSTDPFPVVFTYAGSVTVQLSVSVANVLKFTRSGSVALQLGVTVAKALKVTRSGASTLQLGVSSAVVPSITATYAGSIALPLAVSVARALTFARTGAVSLPIAVSATTSRVPSFVYAGQVSLPLTVSAVSKRHFVRTGSVSLPLTVSATTSRTTAHVTTGSISLPLAVSAGYAQEGTIVYGGAGGLPLAVSGAVLATISGVYAGSASLPLAASAIATVTGAATHAGSVSLPLAVSAVAKIAITKGGSVSLPITVSSEAVYDAERDTIDFDLAWFIEEPLPTAHFTTTGSVWLALAIEGAAGLIIPGALTLDLPLAWAVAGAPPIEIAGEVALPMAVTATRRTSVRIPISWEIEGRSVRLVGLTWNILDGRRARLARLTHIRPRQSAIIAINPRQSVVGIRPRLSLLIYEDA